MNETSGTIAIDAEHKWIKAPEYTFIKPIEHSEWTCYLFGNTPQSTGIVWRPNKGKEPNWFWRLMQYLILGNKWIKDDKV